MLKLLKLTQTMNISILIDGNLILSNKINQINHCQGPSKITNPDESYFVRKIKRKNTEWAGSSAW